jgi:hypothetical protein
MRSSMPPPSRRPRGKRTTRHQRTIGSRLAPPSVERQQRHGIRCVALLPRRRRRRVCGAPRRLFGTKHEGSRPKRPASSSLIASRVHRRSGARVTFRRTESGHAAACVGGRTRRSTVPGAGGAALLLLHGDVAGCVHGTDRGFCGPLGGSSRTRHAGATARGRREGCGRSVRGACCLSGHRSATLPGSAGGRVAPPCVDSWFRSWRR